MNYMIKISNEISSFFVVFRKIKWAKKVELNVTVWCLNVRERRTKAEPMGIIHFGF